MYSASLDSSCQSAGKRVAVLAALAATESAAGFTCLHDPPDSVLRVILLESRSECKSCAQALTKSKLLLLSMLNSCAKSSWSMWSRSKTLGSANTAGHRTGKTDPQPPPPNAFYVMAYACFKPFVTAPSPSTKAIGSDCAKGWLPSNSQGLCRPAQSTH